MYIGHGRLCVCMSACLSLAAFPHGPRCNFGNGRGCPPVVHCLADLQSVHGFRCYDNIHVCKLTVLYTANAYSAEREMLASACTRRMGMAGSIHRSRTRQRATSRMYLTPSTDDLHSSSSLSRCTKVLSRLYVRNRAIPFHRSSVASRASRPLVGRRLCVTECINPVSRQAAETNRCSMGRNKWSRQASSVRCGADGPH